LQDDDDRSTAINEHVNNYAVNLNDYNRKADNDDDDHDDSATDDRDHDEHIDFDDD